MITTQPKMNEEEFGSQQEINMLQHEIHELKTKLAKYEKMPTPSNEAHNLNEENEFDEKHYSKHFRAIFDRYLNYKVNVIDLTMSEMKYCLEILREMCHDKQCLKENSDFLQETTPKSREENIRNIDFKEVGDILLTNEMNQLRDPYHNGPNIQDELESKKNHKTSMSKCYTDNEIEEYHNELQQTYEEAKSKTAVVEECRQNIVFLRTKMNQHQNSKLKEHLIAELYRQQNLYRNTILELRNLEKKTNHLKFGLLQAEMKQQRSISRHISERNISIPFSYNRYIEGNTSYDTDSFTLSHSKEFNTIPSNDVLDYGCDLTQNYTDYNRPEKESECSQILLTEYDQNTISQTAVQKQQKSNKLPSFLQLLIDEDHSISKEQFGVLGVEKIPQKKSCYSDLHGDHNILSPLTKKRHKMKHDRMKMKKDENVFSKNFHIDNDGIETEQQLSQENFYLASNVPNKIILPQEPIFSDTLMEKQKQNGDHITRNFTKISTTGNVNLGNDALFENSDSIQFREFMKTIPLTGDKDVDEEILNFYRLKFQN